MVDELDGEILRQRNSFNLWRRNLSDTVISSIEWEGLPKTVDPLFIERRLFFEGRIIFFAVETDGRKSLVCSSGFGTTNLNVYGIPQKRTINMPNGFTAELNCENSVIMYNSIQKDSEVKRCDDYARRIAEYDSIIDGNSRAQRTPYFLTADGEEDKLSLVNLWANLSQGAPVVKIENTLNPDAIKVFSPNAPFRALELKEVQKKLINEYLTFNGIYHNTDKETRIVSDEVSYENYAVDVNRNAKMLPRLTACNLINEMFADCLDSPISCKMVG